MSIEKCPKSCRTPAECYVHKIFYRCRVLLVSQVIRFAPAEQYVYRKMPQKSLHSSGVLCLWKTIILQKGNPRLGQKHTSNHTRPQNALKTQDIHHETSDANDAFPDFQYM